MLTSYQIQCYVAHSLNILSKHSRLYVYTKVTTQHIALIDCLGPLWNVDQCSILITDNCLLRMVLSLPLSYNPTFLPLLIPSVIAIE